MKQIAVTGGAGQIAYSLLFTLASGALFGEKEKIVLKILEIPEGMGALEGVKMELEDCAFPLLEKVIISTKPEEAFEGVDAAFLVGATPRGPGMERKELLGVNSAIFVGQGKALDRVATDHVRVLVLGNPCNSNCLVAMRQLKKLDRGQFHAMTRLDQNRATGLLAARAGVPITQVERVTIWGNHSSTQVPDFLHATIGGRPLLDRLHDLAWLEGPFIGQVQKRGAAIIAARGKSSAASAAHAAVVAMRDLIVPTQGDGWYSSAIYSAHNPYGIDPDLVFSFPCRTASDGSVQIVAGLDMDNFLKNSLQATQEELIQERALL